MRDRVDKAALLAVECPLETFGVALTSCLALLGRSDAVCTLVLDQRVHEVAVVPVRASAWLPRVLDVVEILVEDGFLSNISVWRHLEGV